MLLQPVQGQLGLVVDVDLHGLQQKGGRRRTLHLHKMGQILNLGQGCCQGQISGHILGPATGFKFYRVREVPKVLGFETYP